MPRIIDTNTLPEETKKAIQAKGFDPKDTLIVFDDEGGNDRIVKKSEQGDLMGLAKTFVSELAEGIIPTAAGLAAGAGTVAATAPTSPLGQLVAGGAGALAGGLGAQYLQSKALQSFAPGYVAEQDIRRRSNPVTATLGQIASGLPFGMGFRGLLASKSSKEALAKAAVPALMGGGMEAASEYTSEGEISPLRVGLAALGNLGQVDNTKLGNMTEAAGLKLSGKMGDVKLPMDITPSPDPYETAAKIMSAHRSGQLVEGSELHKALAAEVDQPDATVEHLIKIASNREKAAVNNNPEVRAELAGTIYDALAAGHEPKDLADSKVEKLIKDLYAAGDLTRREDAVRIAKSAKPEEELNQIKRERLENSGPPPLKPGQRLDDNQIDVLLKVPPETKIPNATKLDEAVMQGRRDGYIRSAQDIRRLEDAYLMNPDLLPAAQRTIFEEKQLLEKGPTAREVAERIQARDTEFFTEKFPKMVAELKSEERQIGKLEKLIEDKNITPEDRMGREQELDQKKKNLDQKWNDFLKTALKDYPDASERQAAAAKVKFTEPVTTAEALGPELDAEGMLRRTGAAMRQAGIEPGTQEFNAGQGLLGAQPKVESAVKPEPAVKPEIPPTEPPPVLHSGLPKELAATFGKMAMHLAKPIRKFIHEGTVANRPFWAGTQPVMERIVKLGPEGEAIRVADARMQKDSIQLFNTAARLYSEAYNSLNAAETKRVNRYLNEMQMTGDSFVILSPAEQEAVKKIRRGLLFFADTGVLRGGPGVAEGALFREMKIDPNYIPTIPDKHVRKVVKEGGPEAEKYAKDWEAWYVNKLGVSPKEARQMMTDYLNNTGMPKPLNTMEFNALTKAEGVGLPPSWRADTQKALMYHAYRAANNFAWFTHVQKNPTVAKAVGVTDDGWGGKLDYDAIPGNTYQINPAVQQWVLEHAAHLGQDEGMIEKLTRIATAFQLGPLTGLRDFISTPAHLMELLPAEDAGLVLKAFQNIMTADVRGDMEKAGAIKNKNLHPFEFLSPRHSDELFDRVVEATRTLQGRNKLESGARQWAYEIGRLAAAGRLQKGDMEFFRKLNLPDFDNLNPQQIIEATGSKFVEAAQGNYRSTGLPGWLLSSNKKNAYTLAFLSIQRWGVERFNNWHNNVWLPAENGDFRPLLKSVFAGLIANSAIETMQELLFNQKPKEMTWSEFLKADNKELAYTLFSKLQNAGFAGVFGGMLNAGAKALSGEPPEEIRNLGMDMAGKALLRLGQAAEAMVNRGMSFTDVFADYLDGYLKDQIQMYRLIRNASRPDLGKREERMMERQQGKAGLSASIAKSMINPFDPMKDLRAAQSEEEIQKALPQVGRALKANPNYDPRLQSSLRPLGPDSYYDFVGKIQGPQAGQAALARDMDQQRLTLLKKQELQRLKWETQIVGGPR